MRDRNGIFVTGKCEMVLPIEGGNDDGTIKQRNPTDSNILFKRP